MAAKVSVIIPVYNMECYLNQALESVTTQTLSDIEIICINDGSTDSSLAILKSWQSSDSRIKIIDKKNEGVGKARNDGIDCATGAFLNFLDPDDLYPACDTLERLYQAGRDEGVLAVGGAVQEIDAEGNKLYKTYNFDSFGIDFSQIGKLKYSEWQYDYGYQAFLLDRKMLLQNQINFPSLSRFQDPPFFVRALAAAGQIYLLDIPTYSYRLWGQMKTAKPQKTADMIKGIEFNLQFARENGFSKLYYLTAMRLQKEVSYVLNGQLALPNIAPVLLQYFSAYANIDVRWLSEQGYDTSALSVPDCLAELLDANAKYKKMRNKRIVRFLSKFLRRGR